jgi:hypothetical protein
MSILEVIEEVAMVVPPSGQVNEIENFLLTLVVTRHQRDADWLPRSVA